MKTTALILSLGLSLGVPASAAQLGADTFADMLANCAPHVHAQTQTSLVLNESGADPLALFDNNPSPGYPKGRSYAPTSYDAAYQLAAVLIVNDRATHGRGIDVGIAQINSHNFAEKRVTLAQMLDACENLRVSSRMLYTAYHLHGSVDAALQVYNSGSPTGAPGYVARVRAAAAQQYVRAVTTRAGRTAVATTHVLRRATAATRSAHFFTEDTH